MNLPTDLLSQFVKVTNDDTKKTSTETTVYGTKVTYDGRTFVQIDGSDRLTPVATTVEVEDDERVTVMIKDHTATITGNISSPAARTGTVTKVADEVTEYDNIMAGKVTADNVQAVNAIIESLIAKSASVSDLTAVNAIINNLQAKLIEGEKISAKDIEAITADIESLKAVFGEFTELSVEDLEAINADIDSLKAYTASFTYLSAVKASVDELNVKKLSAEDAEIKYANIDFANIGKAAFEYFYSQSGLIENIEVGDATISGTLVGVTIIGDMIQGGTIMADKLVIKDSTNGLYYKLNIEGGALDSVELEEVPTDHLHGSIIAAKSITAEKVSVNDLVAFGATIGGFNITSNSIYSEVKDSEGNNTRGIYFDTDGQVNIGDATNYIKYIQNEDGTYSLAISASDILYALNGTQHSLADLGSIGEYVKIGTYEDEPCIELGETDSDFKLVITNTRILFMEGTAVPAYINNQSLYIKKAVIEEEMRLGQFVWQIRPNGNMGLVWQDTAVEVSE